MLLHENAPFVVELLELVLPRFVGVARRRAWEPEDRCANWGPH